MKRYPGKSDRILEIHFKGNIYFPLPSFDEFYGGTFTKCEHCDLYDECHKPGTVPTPFCGFDLGYDYFFEKL